MPRSYTPVENLTEEQSKAVIDELNTELEGLLSYTYSYEENTPASDREQHLADLVSAGVTEDEVVQAEVAAVMDDLTERVAWHNCSQDPSVRDQALQTGVHVEEIPVWGMDSYTRRNIELAMEDLEQPISKSQRQHWIERVLPPAINRQGDHGYDFNLALQDLRARATTGEEKNVVSAVADAYEELGEDHFRMHPKGTGVVCRVRDGIKAQEFVAEYLGELVPAWRWFEKQQAVEAAQKHYGKKPTLPDFYNMLMERHRDDSRGYSVLYIDAAERHNFASSLSHSCDPNCRTTVAAIDKRYGVCLYTVRDIEYGEELTIDYSAATEQEDEFRAAVCLCGSCTCRGSFLHFTGLNETQQFMNRYHTIVDRFAQLVLASSNTPLLIPVQGVMNRHGLRSICVGNMPEWLQKFVALALKFVDQERSILPIELLNTKTRNAPAYTYMSADSESRQMLEQRVQNLAITLSRVRIFLTNQLKILTDPASGYNRQLPPIGPPQSAETKPAPPKVAAPVSTDPGRPWTKEEIQKLASLVAESGASNWAAKAIALGTGRSAASAGKAWKRYKDQHTLTAPSRLPTVSGPKLALTAAAVVNNQPQYDGTELRLTFTQPGPMGIIWDTAPATNMMLVKEIKEGSAAAAFPQLRPGHVLKEIVGYPPLPKMEFEKAIAAIRSVTPPTTFVFSRQPQAVQSMPNGSAKNECALDRLLSVVQPGISSNSLPQVITGRLSSMATSSIAALESTAQPANK
eukprot:COSAG01_NODE_4213_length_5235_cov_2.565031_5_plen_744_part_00